MELLQSIIFGQICDFDKTEQINDANLSFILLPVRSYEGRKNLIKTPYYIIIIIVHGFRPESEIMVSAEQHITGKGLSREPNGVNITSVASTFQSGVMWVEKN